LVSVIHKLINSNRNKEKLSDQWKKSIIIPINKRVMKLTVIIIVGYHCYQFHSQFYRILYPQIMTSSGMLRRVTLVRTDVSEENTILRCVLRLLVTVYVVSSSPILVTMLIEPLNSSETSVPVRVTCRNIPEDGILHFLNRSVFWDITPFTLLKIDRRFGGMYRLHLHGRSYNPSKKVLCLLPT
jgi:hypothetical protein